MTQVYQTELTLPKTSVDFFVDTLTAIAEFAVDLSPLDDPGPDRQLVIYGESDPNSWSAVFSLAAQIAGVEINDLQVSPVPNRDWVVESQKANPEIRAGRFFIYGSHYKGSMPVAKTHNLKIDASTAFGTGQHETTKGCLLQFDNLLKQERFDRVLDLGCGTAILAMAAAKAGVPNVLASDIDHEAVRVSKVNAKINQLQGRLDAVVSTGFDNHHLAKCGPYDLIFANILARPLVGLATPIGQNLRSGGYAILAGLLIKQETLVRSSYLQQGMALVHRIHLGEWSILLVQKR